MSQVLCCKLVDEPPTKKSDFGLSNDGCYTINDLRSLAMFQFVCEHPGFEDCCRNGYASTGNPFEA